MSAPTHVFGHGPGCAECDAEMERADAEHDRLDAICMENARRAQWGDPPSACEACGEPYGSGDYQDYVYGADGDGRRGVRVKSWDCGNCGTEMGA